MGIFDALFKPNIERLGKKKNIKGLIRALISRGDWYTKKDAAEALGEIGDARAVEPLIAAVKDRDAYVREAATEALGKIGDKRAVKPLIAILKDKKSSVQVAAIKALIKMGQPPVESLVTALKDEDLGVRKQAATALGEIGDARVVEPLIARLKDNEYLRWYAVDALGKIGDKRAVKPLIAILKDKELKEAAVEALEKIGWKPSNQAEKISYLRAKLIATKSLAVAKALEKLGWKPSNKVERINYLIATKNWEDIVKIGRSAVEPLIDVMYEAEDSRMSEQAAKALAEIGGSKALDTLKDEGMLIFYCKGCGQRYMLGMNAIVSTGLGLLADSAVFTIIGNGSSFVDNRDNPDLVATLGRRSWNSLESSAVRSQQAEIDRISSLLSTGRPRWWKCKKCGKVQTYQLT